MKTIQRTTSPVVRTLMEKYGEAERGTVIKHFDLEQAIGAIRSTNRFRTCASAWKRAMLREKAILCKAVPGTGYELLPANEQMKEAGRYVRQAARRVFRGLDVAQRTPEHLLGEPERRTRNFMLTSGALLLSQVRENARHCEMALPDAKK